MLKLINLIKHLETANLSILGQNRSNKRQLEAFTELILPFNFHPTGSPIAWPPKAQSCCPKPGSLQQQNPPTTTHLRAVLTVKTAYR